jgi:hypothetical protein
MSLEQDITDFLQNFNSGLSETDKRKLRESARKAGLEKWRWSYGIKAMSVGGLSGLIPSKDLTTISAVMLTDLTALLFLTARASFGIGHIIDQNEVNYGNDILGILSIWTGVAEAVTVVPAGKIGLKLSAKALPKVVGPLAAQLAYKATLKTNAKFASKLTSKVAAKMATKLASKLAGKEVVKVMGPAIGSGASLLIDLWIINGIMDAAHKYYSHPYLATDNELGGLAQA